jgi:hypothetical protein
VTASVIEAAGFFAFAMLACARLGYNRLAPGSPGACRVTMTEVPDCPF